MPARAIGVTSAEGRSRPSAAYGIDPPHPKNRHRAPTFSIPVSVTGAAPGSDAYVMVAAVDVGILNLTESRRRRTPRLGSSANTHMGIELRDLYGRLIDGSLGATGRHPHRRRRRCRRCPPRVVLRPKSSSACFSGAGPSRNGRQGDGRFRHSAVQRHGPHHDRRLDQGSRRPRGAGRGAFRDPVVLTAALPRLVGHGRNAAIMRLDVANTDGPDGDYSLAIETTGDVSTGSAALPEKLGAFLAASASCT